MRVERFIALGIGEWEQCRKFLDTMESHLVEDVRRMNDGWDERARSSEDEDFRAHINELRDEDSRELDELQVILTNSLFAYSYFLFEHRMVRLCKRLEKNHNFPSSIDCIRDYSVSNRVKRYLKQYYGDLLGGIREWGEIQTYRKIRNQIVHGNATIPTECEFLMTYAQSKEIMAGPEARPHFELKRSFCEESLNTYPKFLSQVLDAKPKTT